MSEPKRKFTKEFREETVRWSYTSGKSVVQVARELDVVPDILFHWRKLMRDEHSSSGRRKENQQLRMERDVFKKAIAYFTPRPG